MKRLLLVAFIIASPFIAIWAQTIYAVGQFVTLNASTGTPVVLTNTTVKARKITFVGKKDLRTVNVGTVWVGWFSGNDTQPIEITSGSTIGLAIPDGAAVDLSKVYLDVANANDGVLVIYE